MTDRTVFFDDLLTLPRLRQRTYVLCEPPGAGLVCLDLSARTGQDWFFARRWILVREGRRLLFRTIDRVEEAGFRFQVRTGPRSGASAVPDEEGEPSVRASEFHRSLDPEERRIHRELFPDEANLLERGYDWDARRVFRHGMPLAADAFGRVLEAAEDCLYEWVRVKDEWTWRRYPLQRLRRLTLDVRGT